MRSHKNFTRNKIYKFVVNNNMQSACFLLGNSSRIFTVQTPLIALQKCHCLLQGQKVKIQQGQGSEREVTYAQRFSQILPLIQIKCSG